MSASRQNITEKGKQRARSRAEPPTPDIGNLAPLFLRLAFEILTGERAGSGDEIERMPADNPQTKFISAAI